MLKAVAAAEKAKKKKGDNGEVRMLCVRMEKTALPMWGKKLPFKAGINGDVFKALTRCLQAQYITKLR